MHGRDSADGTVAGDNRWENYLSATGMESGEKGKRNRRAHELCYAHPGWGAVTDQAMYGNGLEGSMQAIRIVYQIAITNARRIAF